MSGGFVFPDSLHDITLGRTGVDMRRAADFLGRLDGALRDRITGITVKTGSSVWTMRFFLDGRKSGKCLIDAEKQAWVDAGVVSLLDLAMHYCTTIKPGFSRKPVQLGLFR